MYCTLYHMSAPPLSRSRPPHPRPYRPPIMLFIIDCRSPPPPPSSCFIIWLSACGPPSCCSICGGSALAICCTLRFWLRALILPDFGIFRPFIFPIILLSRLYSSMSSYMSPSDLPAPRATRRMRLSAVSILTSVLSSSASVMLSMRHMRRFTLAWLAFSCACPISPSLKPGIMLNTWLIGPIFMMFWNCSYSIRSVNSPAVSFSMSSSLCSSGMMSCTLSMKPAQSPKPRSLLTKDLPSNASNSSMCSPVPRKMMGARVAETAVSAPPPLACPSIFVTMTAPTSTLSLNAAAWSCTACPMLASITNTVRSGSTASATCRISSNRSSCCLCLPLVSTIIRSLRSLRKRSTPSAAILAGSRSL
mmetsp:Transcript_9588/g.33417  ORF Transcript_9588/g.33417 Transcript_9588/m.33417 type:complete len:362 (-) Transcript_9588:717-1802(-)